MFETVRNEVRQFAIQVVIVFLSLSLMIANTIAQTQTPVSTSQSQEEKSLVLDQVVESELPGGITHYYQITLSENQKLVVAVYQISIDIKATLFDPKGNPVAESNSPHAVEIPEVVQTISEVAGVYRLAITAVKPNTTGRYKIDVEALSAATPKDIATYKGEKLFGDGLMLSYRNTEESILKAIAKFEEAYLLFKSIGDSKGETVCLSNIAGRYSAFGERQKALEYHLRSLESAKASGDKAIEIAAYHNLGTNFQRVGEIQKSFEAFEKGLALARATKDKRGLPAILSSLGGLYWDLGERQTALSYYEEALTENRKGGDHSNEASTISKMALVYEEAGDKTKALELYQQAYEIAQTFKIQRPIPLYLYYIGRVFADTGNKEKALEFLNQALEKCRATGSRAIEANVLARLAIVYGESGETSKALDYFKQGLEISRAVENKTGEAAVLYYKARFERDSGNLEQARTDIEESLALVESYRTKIGVPSLRASYLATIQNHYELAIDTLMRLHAKDSTRGFDRLAFEMNERARARTLLESLAESQVNIREGVPTELLQKEKALLQKLNARAEAFTNLNPKQADTIVSVKKELEDLRAQYERLQAEIRASSPRYAALNFPTPLGLKEIQQKVLDRDTMLVEYALGKERSYVFVATSDSLQTFTLSKRSEIETKARSVYELLTARNKRVKFETVDEKLERVEKADGEISEATKELSQMILAPVEKSLTKKRLLIIADGALQYVPFAALTVVSSKDKNSGQRTADSGQFLIDLYEIVNLPSASTLAVLRDELKERKPAPKAVAIFADPVFDAEDERFKAVASKGKSSGISAELFAKARNNKRSDASHLTRAMRDVEGDDSGLNLARLPFTRKEADAISALVPSSQSKATLDFSANRNSALNPEISQYRIVHFATHSFVSSAHPELSGIVLSLIDEQGKPQEGFLRTSDVYNLKLPAELVVLSGCKTGLGKEIRGEGLVGFTRGFMYAGAARVAVSLWDVNDEATSELMARFYRGMLKEKLSPSEALRQAQISMMKDKRWGAPYYWASFVLQGEPR